MTVGELKYSLDIASCSRNFLVESIWFDISQIFILLAGVALL